RPVATDFAAAVVFAVGVVVALSDVVERAGGRKAFAGRLIDGVASAVAVRSEFAFGDGIVGRVGIAHLGQAPLFIHQCLDGGHHGRSDGCSTKSGPATWRTGAGGSPIGRVGVADGDVVPPDAV